MLCSEFWCIWLNPTTQMLWDTSALILLLLSAVNKSINVKPQHSHPCVRLIRHYVITFSSLQKESRSLAYQVICHFLVFQLMILANQTCWLRSEFQLTDPLTFQLERRACSEWTEMWEQWGGLVINFLNFQFIYPCVSCMLLSSCLYSVILIVVCLWCCVFVWRPHVLLSDLVSAVSPRCLTLPHSPLCVFIVSVSLFLITFTPSLVVLLWI